VVNLRRALARTVVPAVVLPAGFGAAVPHHRAGGTAAGKDVAVVDVGADMVTVLDLFDPHNLSSLR
jgi:hypothetical protein